MADIVDIAQDSFETYLAARIHEQRRKTEQIDATGCCLNCEEPLDRGAFCDSWCREDFEKRQRALRATGGSDRRTL